MDFQADIRQTLSGVFRLDTRIRQTLSAVFSPFLLV